MNPSSKLIPNLWMEEALSRRIGARGGVPPLPDLLSGVDSFFFYRSRIATISILFGNDASVSESR
jgi:hypothetical protein